MMAAVDGAASTLLGFMALAEEGADLSFRSNKNQDRVITAMIDADCGLIS
jgi:hypothetical protein